MYNPTDAEKECCIDVVKNLFGIERTTDCEQYVEEIFSTIYSIGGDYSEKTIRTVAEAIHESK